MKRHSSGFIIGIVVSLVLGFGIVAGTALSLRAAWGLGYAPPSVLKATPTGPNSATISFSTFPDSLVCHPKADAKESQGVTYCPTTNFEVPPNSVITVVINQYDSASGLINDYFRQVRGTIGSTMTVNGKSMGEISADAPGRTFTLQPSPDTAYPLFVSVPLLGVADDANPNAVTINGNLYQKSNVIFFQFRTGPAGTYVWHCYVSCGSDRGIPYGFSGPMSTTGFMAGTMTVGSY